MIRQNLHTHTIYDDGENTPSEMAEAALAAGLRSLGFSGHSVLPFPNDWSMTEESMARYREDVQRTKEAFSGRLEIFCGLEWDMLSGPPPKDYDYLIGSFHHLPDPPFGSVDEAPETTERLLRDSFSSPDDFAETYYRQYALLAAQPEIAIVGHFDLLTKFNEKHPVFRTDSPRYRDAALAALEVLAAQDKIFEVNTGAMTRGWRTVPYPHPDLLRVLRNRGARILVTSDAHRADAIAGGFSETESLLKELGFREIWEYAGNGQFVPVPL